MRKKMKIERENKLPKSIETIQFRNTFDILCKVIATKFLAKKKNGNQTKNQIDYRNRSTWQFKRPNNNIHGKNCASEIHMRTAWRFNLIPAATYQLSTNKMQRNETKWQNEMAKQKHVVIDRYFTACMHRPVFPENAMSFVFRIVADCLSREISAPTLKGASYTNPVCTRKFRKSWRFNF